MSHRDCSQIFAALSEYLDGELPPATCAELEEHLRGCPECIDFVNSLKRSIDLCRRYGGASPSAPVEPGALEKLQAAYNAMLTRRRTGG